MRRFCLSAPEFRSLDARFGECTSSDKMAISVRFPGFRSPTSCRYSGVNRRCGTKHPSFPRTEPVAGDSHGMEPANSRGSTSTYTYRSGICRLPAGDLPMPPSDLSEEDSLKAISYYALA